MSVRREREKEYIHTCIHGERERETPIYNIHTYICI